MARTRQRQPEPILDNYPWHEPKAKCIIKSKPSEELINPRSPEPIFHRDPQDLKKSYLIITPQQVLGNDSSEWVYKYDIEKDKYEKFAKYPKDYDIDYPMHVFDQNKQILHILDSSKKAKNKALWQLDLETANWEKKSIRLNQNCLFFAKDVRSSWNQNGMKMFDIGGDIRAYDFHCQKQFELCSLERSDEKALSKQLVFVEKEDKIMSFGKSSVNIFDSSIDDLEEPPHKKRKINDRNANCSKMKFKHLGQRTYKEMGLDVTFNRFVAFSKHDYVVFVFDRRQVDDSNPFSGLTSDHVMDVWCLDVFNDSYKWYKSEKRLPQCVCYIAHHHSNMCKNFIHETDNEYVHFMHHSLDHVMIDTVDLVPDELKNIHRNVFQLTVYGYFREQTDIIKFDKNIPASLMYLTQCFLTHFV